MFAKFYSQESNKGNVLIVDLRGLYLVLNPQPYKVVEVVGFGIAVAQSVLVSGSVVLACSGLLHALTL